MRLRHKESNKKKKKTQIQEAGSTFEVRNLHEKTGSEGEGEISESKIVTYCESDKDGPIQE